MVSNDASAGIGAAGQARPLQIPRLVVAAPASGHGKTTVATGLMAALTDRGRSVAPFKVGPDYIDPGYHTLASGRPGRNLDPVLCGDDLVGPLFAHGARGCDVAIIEGVMGLFDGRLGMKGRGSTAHVAHLVDAPVLLVLDVRHTSRSAAAVVAGVRAFDPRIRLGGVVLNQVGSARHEAEVRDALSEVGVPVLGALPRSLDIETPSRHLGLVPAAERDDAGIRAMGAAVAAHVDVDAIEALAASAPSLAVEPWAPEAVVAAPPAAHSRPVVAVAGGRAFTFRYAETDELLRAAGCEPVVFDPLTDAHLPEGAAGLWLGGGFPEVHAADLAANGRLLAAIRDAVEAGMPTVAECAGLLYLCRTLDGIPMVGAVPGEATMRPRLTMGYREATTGRDTLLGRVGERIIGHEFHRTGVDMDAAGAPSPAWLLDGLPHGPAADGWADGNVHAAYLHVHWAGHPQLAQRFADAIHQWAQRGVSAPFQSAVLTTAQCEGAKTPAQSPSPNPSASRPGGDDREPLKSAVPTTAQWKEAEEQPRREAPEPAAEHHDLWHHGDRDLAPGLVDLAVNVRQPRTPAWLMRALTEGADWASYPDPSPARDAIATHHGVDPAMVLPTAGAAEAFTLIARALPGTSMIIHPQFTEPEAALLAAGRRPERHLLRPEDAFALRPQRVPPADLVMVGNPTNPTGVLHSAADLRRLDAGVLVVDEAFLDAVPGEPETMIAPTMPGVLVLRSLTKTWALAGLRAGYVVGDPALIEQLAVHQPPWSVSTPAITAMQVCLGEQPRAEAARLAADAEQHRADLDARLRALGLVTVPGMAPFVLVNTSAISPHSMREPLARRGFAVRRGETFPGLDPTWLRLAVRTPDVHAALVDALTAIIP